MTSSPRADGSTKLQRLRAIATVMARHGFAPTMRRMPLVRAFVRGDEQASKAPVAERFASMLEELGPAFVKLGQILSTRADLLPPDFIVALSRLQDQVPPFAFSQVQETLASSWGVPVARIVGDVLASIDETPLASASMAQVHAATLQDGSDVVVKVQRPGIAEQVRRDSEILVLLAELLEIVVAEASAYHAVDLVTEFQLALRSEVDFTLEARNLRSFARANAQRPTVKVPAVHDALSGPTVLVMERIYGCRITDVRDDPARAQRVTGHLVQAAFEHVFVDGLFHGDPHPGNLLVTSDDRVAFIDFGLVGRVPRETQDRMLLLLIALSLRDADTVARLIVRLGETSHRVELNALRLAVGKLLDRYLGLVVSEVETAAVLTDLVDLSQRFGVHLPREFAILSKASVSLEGIVRTLHPGFNPSSTITQRAEELLIERLDPRQLKGGGLRTALQLGLVLQELPVQLGQTLMDLERGHIQVVVRSEEIEALGRNLRGLGMTFFGAILAGSFLLGGFDVLARSGFGGLQAPLVATAAFVVAGGCFGVAFGWYATGGRLPKIALARLVGRSLDKARAMPRRNGLVDDQARPRAGRRHTDPPVDDREGDVTTSSEDA